RPAPNQVQSCPGLLRSRPRKGFSKGRDLIFEPSTNALEEIAVTAAQATIRRLYEQVRVLEAEAARPPKRRARLPYVGVLVAAVAIGAVSAGVSRSHVAVAVHKRAAAPVAHLIHPPAELARA